MSNHDLTEYINRECRFKLKSGQEVFGVLWEVASQEGASLYFTSLFNATRVRANNDFELASELGHRMELDEILLAEKLVG